jgi:hypothetical protein
MTTTKQEVAPFAVDAVIIKAEDIIEGVVVAIEKAALYVDLGVSGTGIIYGFEFMMLVMLSSVLISVTLFLQKLFSVKTRMAT